MKIETIEQARGLVGRTFERDGKRRTVNFIGSFGGVIQRLHDKRELLHQDWRQFRDWLSGATEVTQ